MGAGMCTEGRYNGGESIPLGPEAVKVQEGIVSMEGLNMRKRDMQSNLPLIHDVKRYGTVRIA